MPANTVRCTLAGLGMLAPLLGLCSGCQAAAVPFLMWGAEPTKPVPAEYPYLTGRKLCIVVWADMETQFEYPHVQFELAEHLRAALEGNVTKVTFVPNRQVVDLQRRDPAWDRTPPAALGKRFGAERVLLIELAQYATREPESPHIFRGRITANLKVYNTDEPQAEPAHKRTVETVFPADGPGRWGTDDATIRRATMEAFAAEAAGLFYDRRVKVR